ncbi:prefoldin subunit 4 isoform X1 [Stegostoma tigrinum]|uniref:prefoldin subunit 4 isoform X1 n=1 Tax=Stegostoma tigrinum TaxID=3053191 RepID=UPI00202B56FD|nr:prefoldin subunit 4 isoform X1 [Stegostoma tigrinum]
MSAEPVPYSMIIFNADNPSVQTKSAYKIKELLVTCQFPLFTGVSHFVCSEPLDICLIHLSMIHKHAVEDVNVTFEDQQKINKFARNNNRLIELKEEIELKKKQLQNLEDASDDIMMLDEDTMLVPYQIGEVFISHSQDETQEMLEAAKQSFQDDIHALQTRVETIQQVLSDLKIQLYAKFGNNINLEADDN